MGKEPDPHACRPNSMDLNDAADYQNIMGCPHPWKTF